MNSEDDSPSMTRLFLLNERLEEIKQGRPSLNHHDEVYEDLKPSSDAGLPEDSVSYRDAIGKENRRKSRYKRNNDAVTAVLLQCVYWSSES